MMTSRATQQYAVKCTRQTKQILAASEENLRDSLEDWIIGVLHRVSSYIIPWFLAWSALKHALYWALHEFLLSVQQKGGGGGFLKRPDIMLKHPSAVRSSLTLVLTCQLFSMSLDTTIVTDSILKSSTSQILPCINKIICLINVFFSKISEPLPFQTLISFQSFPWFSIFLLFFLFVCLFTLSACFLRALCSPVAWSVIANSKTRFDTEAKDNLEMAYWM